MEAEVRNQIDLINQKIKELNALYHLAAWKAKISDGELSIWSVLLYGEEEYSQLDLCEALFLPKQTINSLVTSMAKKGYVTLEHVPGTRNRKIIRLTEAGRAYGKENVQWIFDAEQKAMEDTDAQEISACISMMERYTKKLRNALEGTVEEP